MKGRSGVRGRMRCVRWREELDNSSKSVTIDGWLRWPPPRPPQEKKEIRALFSQFELLFYVYWTSWGIAKVIYWAKCFGVFFLHSTSCCQLSLSVWSLQQRSWMEANKVHKIYLFQWRIRDEALRKPFPGTSRLLLPRWQAVSQHPFSKIIVSVFLLTKLPGRSTRTSPGEVVF